MRARRSRGPGAGFRQTASVATWLRGFFRVRGELQNRGARDLAEKGLKRSKEELLPRDPGYPYYLMEHIRTRTELGASSNEIRDAFRKLEPFRAEHRAFARKYFEECNQFANNPFGDHVCDRQSSTFRPPELQARVEEAHNIRRNVEAQCGSRNQSAGRARRADTSRCRQAVDNARSRYFPQGGDAPFLDGLDQWIDQVGELAGVAQRCALIGVPTENASARYRACADAISGIRNPGNALKSSGDNSKPFEPALGVDINKSFRVARLNSVVTPVLPARDCKARG